MEKQKNLEGNLSKKYRYMSLVIAHSCNFSEIIIKLRARGFVCEIETQFLQLGFKASSSSAPLFHNDKFQLLHKEVSYNKEYQFKGKYLLLITVTQCLKFLKRNDSNPLIDANLLTLHEYLEKRFPVYKNTLQMFVFTNEEGEKELFVRTGDRLATMLVYYVLHHTGERIIFKNPKHFESLSKEKREENMKVLFPKLGS